MRRAARTDAPHQSIVDAFRALGVSVKSTAAVGGGFPDLVIANRRSTALVEVKDGSKSPSKRELTPDQVRFHANWKGRIFTCLSIVEVPNIVSQL